MIMNVAVAAAVTELFVTSTQAGLPFIVLAQCCRLKVSKTLLNNSPCVASPVGNSAQGGPGLSGLVHEEAHPCISDHT